MGHWGNCGGSRGVIRGRQATVGFPRDILVFYVFIDPINTPRQLNNAMTT